MLAAKLTILANNAMMTTAIWANNITITPSAFDDGLLALVFSGEIRGKGNNAVELLEINHNAELFL